jgi:predicted nucleotide-binding protein
MRFFLSKAKVLEDFVGGLQSHFYDNKEIIIFDRNLFHCFKKIHCLYDTIELEKELNKPDYALIILTPEYLQDEWLLSEMNSLFMLEQHRQQSSFIIPVLADGLSDDKIPRYITDAKLNPLDIRGKTTQEGVSIVATHLASLTVDNKKVFIGHGRSQAWKGLQSLLESRFHLQCEEFNSEPRAGYSTQEVLLKMLDETQFAFLVMTAEDEHGDNKLHARQNVIHEVGLFQGRLGFKKAIILLEEGCDEFSNIHGLTHIPFPKGNIRAVSEDIWEVLKRERLAL